MCLIMNDEIKILPDGFYELLGTKFNNRLNKIDNEYFTVKCKDSCVIRFRTDTKNKCLVAELPFIVTDFRGVYSRYIEVKEKRYEKESVTLWVNFVVSIVTRYDTGAFDTYKNERFCFT